MPSVGKEREKKQYNFLAYIKYLTMKTFSISMFLTFLKF